MSKIKERTIKVELSKEDIEDILEWYEALWDKGMMEKGDWYLKDWLEKHLEVLKQRE